MICGFIISYNTVSVMVKTGQITCNKHVAYSRAVGKLRNVWGGGGGVGSGDTDIARIERRKDPATTKSSYFWTFSMSTNNCTCMCTILRVNVFTYANFIFSKKS